MALGICRDCGHQMSTSASSCPKCGCTEYPKTKKIRTVTCSICKGYGYYYSVETSSSTGYMTEFQKRYNDGVAGRKYYGCTRDDYRARKCDCNDGYKEEEYYD